MKYLLTLLFILGISVFSFSQNTCVNSITMDDPGINCLDINFDDAEFDVLNLDCVNNESTHNLWFDFIADGPEIYIYADHELDQDVYISIVRFTALDCDPVKFSAVACDTNSLFFDSLLIVGEKYHVILNVENNEGGNVNFCIQNTDITPPPSNDLPCEAQLINADSTCYTGTTVNAEADIMEFQCSPDFTNEVWFEFQLSEGQFFGAEIFISDISLGGDVRVVLSEYIAGNCENAMVIKQQYCGPASGLAFDYVNLEQGETYFISVATLPGEAGEFSLCVKEMEALPHTNACDAISIIPNDACLSFDTYYSIFEYDLPNCDYSNQKIWYKFFTGTELNEITLDLNRTGNEENVFLGLGYFQGNWCENTFHWVDSYCGIASEASFSADNLMENQLYHIVVGTNYGFTGEFELCIDGDYNSPYTNDHPCTAYNIETLSGCVGGSSKYGATHTQDTICFDLSPIKKTWYKVNLERYDYAIDVEFAELTNVPLHKLQVGYFEDGCLDDFIVVNDFCGVQDSSTTSYVFPDSIDYAYIAISLPTDQDYNYSVCVNPVRYGISCNANDFCSEAVDYGLIKIEESSCLQACTFGATIEDTEAVYISEYATTWYEFTTDDVDEIEVEFSNGTTPQFFIGLVENGNCDAEFVQSNHVQLTNFQSLRMNVTPFTTYKMAFAAIDEYGGSVEMCITGKENDLCSVDDKIVVQQTSLGSPLEGPFQEGETVSFCYSIESYNVVNESSCQWLQGIVPSFGKSWSEESFDEVGFPVISSDITALSGGVNWAWKNDVHSHISNEYRRLRTMQNGNLNMCHVLEPNCEGEEVIQGDLLPPGWYAWNSSQGVTHPDSTYGDGVSCEVPNGPWDVCFDLIVGELSSEADLSIKFHTFSDGEIGFVGQADSSCMEDMPIVSHFSIECNSQAEDTIKTILTCSENTTTLELPSEQYYFWFYIVNDRIEGAAAGSGSSISVSLTNETDQVQRVQYFIKAYSGNGCHLTNYTYNIDVYPVLDIAREALFTICLTDSVSMSEVIDLESQIIGEFTVDWESDDLIDEPDGYWGGATATTIPYSVISEAGCLFADTVYMHVEDVIVGDALFPYSVCRGDEMYLSQALPLNSLITDMYTVDWEYGDLEDIPHADTSFEASTKIPFTITGETGCIFHDTLEIEVPHVGINVLGMNEFCSTDTVSKSAGYMYDLPHTIYWLLPNGDSIPYSGLSRPADVFDVGDNYLEFHLITEQGCPFYDYDTITIFEVPQFSFNQDTQFLGICPYDSLTLTVETSSDTYEINWDTPFGESHEKEIVTNQEGWYHISAGYESASISCVNESSFHLEIYPAVETSFDYDPIVCIGDSSLVVSEDPNYKFNWSSGQFSSEVLLPPGEYFVTVSTGPGCKNIFDISISEQAIPAPTFTYDDSLCEGDSTWIVASEDDLFYAWSNEQDSLAILSFGGEYTVTVSDSESCVDSFDLSIDVVEYPEVDFDFELIQDSLFLTNLSGEAEFCQWMINDDLIDGSNDTLIILPEGDYAIALSCNNGDCGDFVLEEITVVITGLEDESKLNWKIYPNPSDGLFFIDFSEFVSIDRLIIVDINGKEVYSKSSFDVSDRYHVDMDISSGVYFVKVLTEQGEWAKRVIVL